MIKVSGTTGLEDVLAKEGKLTEEQVSLIKLEHINTGRPVEEIVKSYELVSDLDLVKARAAVLNVPFIDLTGLGVSPEVLNFISEAVATRYHLLPFGFEKEKNLLSVAMEDPLDIQVISFLEKKAGTKIKAFLAASEQIKKQIKEQYAQTLTSEVTEALKEIKPPEELTQEKVEEIAKAAPVAEIVKALFEFALKARASDIHLEPQEDRTRVRYRIDGILHEKLALPKAVHDSVVSRIKILSNLKIDERRLPQDGRLNFKSGEAEIDVRVSSLPTSHGEKMVLRLLRKTGGIPSLPELGLRGKALKNLEIEMLKPHGIIIVCGPTGSGKTTTLYSLLSKLNSVKVNIVTLEDPVEYQLAGINQVQINPAAGLTFASGLRAFLRQDPNIILVGEIRDSETTELAIQASLTGHLVFSTLHTNSAAGALPRLLDMGGEPFLLASSLNAALGQRIVRKICLHCRLEFQPPEEVVNDIKKVLGDLLPEKYLQSPLILYRGQGCDQCGGTGYFGRLGIFEVLPVSDQIAKLILKRVSAGEVEKQAIEEGMITMKQDGYLKVLEGISTIEEVLRVAQD